MNLIRAVILAAGKGTRLKPLTDRMPKCLAPIAGRPVLDYWFDLLADAGVRDVLINTHTFPDQMQHYVDGRNRNACWSVRATYEPELLGSAGTIAANAEFAVGASEVIIIYADNLSDVDLRAMVEYHRSHDDPMTMLLFRAANPRACGIAELDEDDRIIAFTEKPEHPVSDLANAGVYVLDAETYREIAELRAFDFGFDVLPRYVGRMRGWTWTGHHRDMGTPEAYAKAQADAKEILAARGANAEGETPAVFLDRDGTVIEQVHYIADPDAVRILPGVPEALRRLRRAGFRLVVVSNQSAVGRGVITSEQADAVNERMSDLLAREGVVFDAIHTCTSVPASSDRTAIDDVNRKPGPGMLQTAARERCIDLARSWMVGDLVSDVLAGHHAGCRGNILVRSGKNETHDAALSGVSYETAADLSAAVDFILDHSTPEGDHRTAGSVVQHGRVG